MAKPTKAEGRLPAPKPTGKPKKKSLGQVLMELVRARGAGGRVSADEVARAFRPPQAGEERGKEMWRSFTRQVRGEAIGFARKGEIEILRRGEVIDPAKPFKGVYTFRMKQPAAPGVSRAPGAPGGSRAPQGSRTPD